LRRRLFRHLALLYRHLQALGLDVHAKPPEQAHIHVRDADEREEADDVSPPVVEQQAEPREHDEERRDVVAQAVFTGQRVEELPLNEPAAGPAAFGAVLAGFAKDFLVSDRPCDRGDGQREQQQPRRLQGNPGRVG
jgi:hypothetical protein